MELRFRLLALFAVAGLGATGVSASAQTASPPIPQAAVAQAAGAQTPRQELDPAQNLPAPTSRPRRNDDVLASPEPGPCPLASSTLKFTLKSVSFTGADKVRLRDLEAAFQGDLGRNIGLANVCRIRDRASDILFRRGLLARVEVPEQRIEAGRLQLRVIEAHVVSVQVRGDAGPAQERVEIYLQKLRGMRPFDIRRAQRYLLLAADVPGVRVGAALRPAAESAGAVDLLVTVSRKPVDALVNIQNFGSSSLGPVGAVARLDFNGFTRYGERTTLVIYSTLGNADQRVVQLLSEDRLGNGGLTTHGSVAYAWSAPGGELAALKLQGRSLVVDAGVSYPVIRARRTNLNLGGGFDLIDQRTAFGQGGVLSEDHLRIFLLHADAERQWPSFAGLIPAGVFSGDMEFRRGVDGLGSSLPGQASLSRIGGRPDGSVIRGDARLSLAWMDKLTSRIVFSGQYSAKPLLAYEQFTVGVLTIGRGYDPAALTGDQGVGGSLELHAGPFAPPRASRWPAGVNLSAFVFYDVAAVFSREVGGTDRTLHSEGGGLNLQFTPRLRLDVSYARPLDKPSEFSQTRPRPRVLVSLTTSIL